MSKEAYWVEKWVLCCLENTGRWDLAMIWAWTPRPSWRLARHVRHVHFWKKVREIRKVERKRSERKDRRSLLSKCFWSIVHYTSVVEIGDRCQQGLKEKRNRWLKKRKGKSALPGNRTRVARMGILHDTTTPAVQTGNAPWKFLYVQCVCNVCTYLPPGLNWIWHTFWSQVCSEGSLR